jgi:hypothetical protein
MLPILRTISVGGVLLAITILGLALIPPSRTSLQLAAGDAPARGALIDRLSHPEWRQFLIMSALKRAEEVDRLRELPDMPSNVPEAAVPVPEPMSRMAGLPSAPSEVAPDDETGSINVAPAATMPIDIGEQSSFELPLTPGDDTMPVTTLPVVSATANSDMPAVSAGPPTLSEPPLSRVAVLSPLPQSKPVIIIRKRPAVRKPVAAKPQTPQATVTAPPPFNFFQAIFASLATKPAEATAAPPKKKMVLRRPRIKAKKTASR